MTEEELIEEFLTEFKQLEIELVKNCGLKDNYISFSRALNVIHSRGLDPVIASTDVYEFLKTASDLRNILSHRNNVAAPTEEFLNTFKRISSNIIHPTLCLDVATKGNNILIGHTSDCILTLMRLMSSRFLSHIPVYDENSNFVGVFSRTTLFEMFLKEKKINLDESTKVIDIIKFIDLAQHNNEQFMFVDKYTKIIDVYEKLLKHSKEERKLSCIFITAHGKANERLLGVVTQVDLLKIAAELD